MKTKFVKILFVIILALSIGIFTLIYKDGLFFGVNYSENIVSTSELSIQISKAIVTEKYSHFFNENKLSSIYYSAELVNGVWNVVAKVPPYTLELKTGTVKYDITITIDIRERDGKIVSLNFNDDGGVVLPSEN